MFQNFHKLLILLSAIFLLLATPTSAAQIGFVKSNIWASKTTALVGDKVNIFVVLVNSEDNNLEGDLQFLDDTLGQNIGSAKPFALTGGGSSNVISTQWTAVAGEHRFRAKIVNAVSIDKLNVRTSLGSDILSELSDAITVKVDSDHDGVTDDQEIINGTNPNNPDTDHDGLPDGHDPDPTNPDTDGDGDKDGHDPAPTNGSVFTPPDTDHDGIPDASDSDIDNDGIFNWVETKNGTDPNKADTDGDHVRDKQDVYPLDPKRFELEVVAKPVAVVVSPPARGGDEEGVGGVAPTTTDTNLNTVENENTDGKILGEKITNTGKLDSKLHWPWWLNGLGILWLVLLLVLLAMMRKRKQKSPVENKKEEIKNVAIPIQSPVKIKPTLKK